MARVTATEDLTMAQCWLLNSVFRAAAAAVGVCHRKHTQTLQQIKCLTLRYVQQPQDLGQSLRNDVGLNRGWNKANPTVKFQLKLLNHCNNPDCQFITNHWRSKVSFLQSASLKRRSGLSFRQVVSTNIVQFPSTTELSWKLYRLFKDVYKYTALA